ncbi:Sec-independent protein translocase protein TatB [Acetobacter fallax]|uniref:Sec-independent protein translocase protein TatB n=1 Tax=Acetobacter fallax TaxID=1737473 RepID=A0ABX0KE79_9PROT|nr:Sec-independent protein translocase protein TatB [Acetobacter fallax]NHO33897.1 twin-arginine translocase subunit TatB [Acetobacter fallax]NHO37464.1 twin-arginine translocase subunit TatB [Acetobacter fallax]
MFDFAWSEFALIGVVALLVIGPKDMPVAIRTVARAVRKARGLAGEFQSHVDEMVREADLGEVRDHVRDLRNLDVRGKIMRTIDENGRLRRSLDDPMTRQPPLISTATQSVPVLPSHDGTENNGTGDFQPPPLVPPPARPVISAVPLDSTISVAFQNAEVTEAPACLPPSIVRRIASGRRHMLETPAFLPPPRVLHGDRRVAPFEAPPPEGRA